MPPLNNATEIFMANQFSVKKYTPPKFFEATKIWTPVIQNIHAGTEDGNFSFFKPKIRGLYTRAITDQERVIVARVR